MAAFTCAYVAVRRPRRRRTSLRQRISPDRQQRFLNRLPKKRLDREQVLGAGDVAIRAPMLGTFYRSPSPGEPAFVEVGQRVRADDTVCLIEVMKLFPPRSRPASTAW